MKNLIYFPTFEPPQKDWLKFALAIEVGEFPAMKEIVKRDIPKSESDWECRLVFGISTNNRQRIYLGCKKKKVNAQL